MRTVRRNCILEIPMPYLLLLTVPAFFGLNPITARALAESFGPGTLTGVRWVGCALLIGVIALLRGKSERWRLPWSEVPKLVALSALGLGFCSYAAYIGVRTTTATTVGLIYSCTSALVALYEVLRGATRPTLSLASGITACMAGVVVILTRGDFSALGQFSLGVGELWAVAGMLGWAVYTIAMNRAALTQTPLAQFTTMAVVAVLVCLPVSLMEIGNMGLPVMTATTPLWIASLVLFAGSGAYLGYSWSIRVNGPVLTAASLSLVPLYVAGMAVVLIGEEVGWYHALAIALVVTGLGLINFERMRGR
jgi:drug/metabolite transporter (DMT)-like permease